MFFISIILQSYRELKCSYNYLLNQRNEFFTHFVPDAAPKASSLEEFIFFIITFCYLALIMSLSARQASQWRISDIRIYTLAVSQSKFNLPRRETGKYTTI